MRTSICDGTMGFERRNQALGRRAAEGGSSLSLPFAARPIQQPERGPYHALKSSAVRLGSRQHADAKQYPQQQTRDVASIDVRRSRFVGFGRGDAPSEKSFDLAELLDNNRAAFGLMGRDLKGRVHQKTAFAMTVSDRVFDDFGKETVD